MIKTSIQNIDDNFPHFMLHDVNTSSLHAHGNIWFSQLVQRINWYYISSQCQMWYDVIACKYKILLPKEKQKYNCTDA